MKKNKILRLGLLALALTLVTGSLVSGTFAKYVTTVTGTGTVTVANWSVKLTDGKDTAPATYANGFNIAMLSKAESGIESTDLIAPGSTGTFRLGYDTSGSEVARTVSITLSKPESELLITDLPLTYAVSVDGAISSAIVLTGDTPYVFTKHFDAGSGATNGKGYVDVTWTWERERTGMDGKDTEFGVATAKDYKVNVKFEATQDDLSLVP